MGNNLKTIRNFCIKYKFIIIKLSQQKENTTAESMEDRNGIQDIGKRFNGICSGAWLYGYEPRLRGTGRQKGNEELHIGYVAFSPLANGFLSAKYGKDSKFDPGTDYRSMMPQFTPEAVEQNQKLLKLIETVAEGKQATPGQISLAWMLGKKPYLVPIPGTRKSDRLKENAGAVDIKLTAKEIEVLDRQLDTMEMSDVFGGTSCK